MAVYEMNDAPTFMDMRTVKDKEPIAASAAGAATAVCCLLRTTAASEGKGQGGKGGERLSEADHCAAAARCVPAMVVSASAAGVVRLQQLSPQLQAALAGGLGRVAHNTTNGARK